MHVLLDIDKATLQYNRETNSIEVIWKKIHDEETYKRIFTEGVRYIKEFGSSSWLSDIRYQGIVAPTTAKWLQQEIIPKAMSYGLKRIAVVMDADIFKEFYVKNVENITKANSLMKHFGSIESAHAWLKEKEAVNS